MDEKGTQMDVTGVLIGALRAIEEARLPEDLRITGFAKAVDLISGSSFRARGLLQADGRVESEDVDGSAGSLDQIAQRLKLGVPIVEEVYHAENGEIEITVPSGKLESGKKPGTRQLALLVVAGRQGAGIEEFTSLDVIRKVAEDFRRYDPPNFARTIAEMSDVFNFRGSNRKKEVRMSRPGWEAAKELVNRLGGGDI